LVDLAVASPNFAMDIRAAAALSVDLTTGSTYTQTCPTLLPSFVATLDGQPMSVERGSVQEGGLDVHYYECSLPRLLTHGRGRQLHIADETGVLDIDLGDATDPRTMQPSSTTLTRGGSFDVTWSPAADLEGVSHYAILYYLDLERADLATTVGVDGVLHLTMPTAAELSYTGAAQLVVAATVRRDCPYPKCTIKIDNDLQQGVTVQ